MTKKRIALACQGGGSHTAFTAGVLRAILENQGDRFEIVGFSGTSGGAICAALSWYGLVTGGSKSAIAYLNQFWEGNSVNSAWEAYLNYLMVLGARMRGQVSLPELSPYTAFPSLGDFTVSDWAHRQLRGLLEKLMDFNRIEELVSVPGPDIFIGTINVLSGEFEVFNKKNLTVEALLASSAIPSLFKAVRVRDNYYWDGLFSQNPPIRQFLTGRDAGQKPDEIWVIQINPTTRDTVPMTIEEILDRRNELSGNLSLNQEIAFIETINEILHTDQTCPSSALTHKYKQVIVRKITLDLDLDYATKLDRSPGFIQDLILHGVKKGNEFSYGQFESDSEKLDSKSA